MDNLDNINLYEQEWTQSKKVLKKKLKLRFWFFQNLSAFFFVSLFILYWFLKSPQGNLLIDRFQYLVNWLISFLLS
jgi:hypothetical protein